MPILFHPTHRRFIKLLHLYADRGVRIRITNHDKERFAELIHRTSDAEERHRSIYKLLIEILNRETPLEEGCLFTHDIVDYIERMFADAERRRPCVTFQGVVILPLLRYLFRKLNKRE